MLRLVVASALSVLVFAELLVAQSALDRVRASGRLRVGIDATYPPFGIAEGGEFSGFDVDIARAIARELGVEAELVNAGFDGVFPALQHGSFDVVDVQTRAGHARRTLTDTALTRDTAIEGREIP